ncbi:hypothetical protein GCM10023350_35080 [Nocardioides endophyticus]|uniref:Uncharacterized protein n=1 Tax=Nocardioides endophyticus TaxID=1353775 RepID=A0ABP8Z687_9ACTN
MDVEPDCSDIATPLEASGSAGLALECVGEPRRGGGGNLRGRRSRDGAGLPEDALENWLDEEFAEVPEDGYRVERVDDGRVLLSYDVDDRTRVAVVVHDDITSFPGAEHCDWQDVTWLRLRPDAESALVDPRVGAK